MFIKGLSLLFLGFGIFVLVQVVMPLLSFKAFELFAFDQASILVDPDPRGTKEAVLGVSLDEVAISNIGNFPAFVGTSKNILPAYKEFKLSVPKLNLKDIKVMVYSNEFDAYLGQLPGSAMPGERGNTFITGHSSLPINLQKEQIPYFKDLPEIKPGDEIVVEANGQRFTYVTMGLKIVDPKDVSVINPPDNMGRYLTLMTCVPPGFNTKRLVVLSRLKT